MKIWELDSKSKAELIDIIKGLEGVINDMALNIKFIKRQNKQSLNHNNTQEKQK